MVVWQSLLVLNTDPRLLVHYSKVTERVGIDEKRDELIKMLT
jgi:hypothetical protein